MFFMFGWALGRPYLFITGVAAVEVVDSVVDDVVTVAVDDSVAAVAPCCWPVVAAASIFAVLSEDSLDILLDRCGSGRSHEWSPGRGG